MKIQIKVTLPPPFFHNLIYKVPSLRAGFPFSCTFIHWLYFCPTMWNWRICWCYNKIIYIFSKTCFFKFFFNRVMSLPQYRADPGSIRWSQILIQTHGESHTWSNQLDLPHNKHNSHIDIKELLCHFSNIISL